jgi:anti-sigma factor RsiW
MEMVEAVAAGAAEADDALRAHLESCPGCAAALADARRIELALSSRPAPTAPQGFDSRVMQRVRRERWTAEQQVDRLFNVAMAMAFVLVVGGGLALLNLGSVAAAASGMWDVLSVTSTEAVRFAAPTMPTYMAAVGLLLTALVMWWWAERAFGLE